MAEALVWGGFTQSALDAAYNNMAAVADSQSRLDGWSARSASLRALNPFELEIPYGPRDRNRFDIFRAGPERAPLMVFIHGGWWQRNSKEVFSCMAEGPLAHGVDVALIGYTLAPDASLTQIAAEVIAALNAVAAHEGRRGGADRCLLAGWSAGGHLTALSLAHPFVGAGLAISGVYDLAPVRHAYVNDKLNLSEAEVAALSPQRLPPPPKPLTLTWGLGELPEMIRQSADYAASGVRWPNPPEALPLPKHDHFSILDELSEASGAIAQAAARLAKQVR